ncbi:hypothetical protein AYI68_g7172 [Smittium mucronatum]|uniref:Uncharacterized protein n=1 Tax=Smittium mucronatum TaxID=133383 RepID=A0A1R0GPE5_9FUNG|nr:hypothetical protein AYI68_g7172 [Smittium mucronatum]
MGMFMCSYELVVSGSYSYKFSPEVDAWRDWWKIEMVILVNLGKEPVMEDLVASLLGLSLSSDPKPPLRFSHIIPTLEAVQTLNEVSSGSKGQSLDRLSKGAIYSLSFLLSKKRGEEARQKVLTKNKDIFKPSVTLADKRAYNLFNQD